jgi:O-methyltransferase involved in polyketide biosynthesis
LTDFHAREIDVTTASAARLYDYYLGGDHNYSIDRTKADQILEACPFMRDLARDNRRFLRRVIRFCAERGIRQFIDMGSGIPTAPNVHDIAQTVDPGSRVIYVDNDLEAVVTAHEMLDGNESATCIEADLRQPETILENPDTGRLIDFSQPTALLMVALLHFVDPDDEPHTLVRRYLDHLPSGSYFAASHISVDDATEQARNQLRAAAQEYGTTSNPATIRTREEFAHFFDGLDLVEPGITFAADWHSDGPADRSSLARPCFYAAVGHKPLKGSGMSM